MPCSFQPLVIEKIKSQTSVEINRAETSSKDESFNTTQSSSKTTKILQRITNINEEKMIKSIEGLRKKRAFPS